MGLKPFLQVSQDAQFTRREWALQRVGWSAILGVLVLALLGVFGRGPLSHAERAQGPLKVSYERFVRAEAPTRLRVEVDGGPGETLVLAITRPYLEKFDVQGMRPQPLRTTTSAEEVRYEFAVSPGATAHIVFEMNPHVPGVGAGAIRLAAPGNPRVPLWHLIYP